MELKPNLNALALMVAIFFIGASQVNAQVLTEDQVPFNMQSYLYTEYPGATVNTWEIIKDDAGTSFYQVSLVHESNNVVAVIDQMGHRIYEDLEYVKTSAPVHLLDHASSNFGKSKVVSVHRHTNYTYGENAKQEINYQMVLKVGKETSIVWFDEGMYRHDTFETSNLAFK